MAVGWNSTGSLGFPAGQDASIDVINPEDNKTDIIKCKHTPVTLIIPNGENSFLAVWYYRNILEYEKKGDKWELKRTITTDTGKKPAAAARGSVSKQLEKFQQMEVQKRKFGCYFKTSSPFA